MKKLFALLCCLSLALSLAGCGGEKTHDFRGADWGMTPAEVAKTESTEYLYADDAMLYFQGEMEGQKADIYYEFTDGALTAAQVKFVVTDGMILAESIENWQAMREYLTGIYGSPLAEDFRVWSSDEAKQQYANDPDNIPVYWQVLTYESAWQTERTDLSFSLDYKDLQINSLLRAAARELPAEG